MAAPTNNDETSYTYKEAGFSAFLRRSIDMPSQPATTLMQYSRNAQQNTRSINFDNAPVSGNLSGITRVGDKLLLDGIIGRISILDDSKEEVGRIGSTSNG